MREKSLAAVIDMHIYEWEFAFFLHSCDSKEAAFRGRVKIGGVYVSDEMYSLWVSHG